MNGINQRERLKQILLTLSYEKREVTLASGRKSDFYFDGRQTALNPEGAVLLGQLFLDEVLKFPQKIEAVGGPTLGADPLVTSISIESYRRNQPIPAFIIRKETKAHGSQNWIEGLKNLKIGMRVAIIEDVITTGESSLKAAQKTSDAGFKVVGIFAMIDREEGGRAAIEKAGFPLITLFKKSELL